MNTIHSIVPMKSHRIPPCLKRAATRLGSLILLFQRMPIVQFLFPEANIIGGASLANSVSLAVTTVIGLGAYDSVSGQSQINQKAPLNVIGKTPAGTSPLATNAINVPATVSASLSFGFNWDPTNKYSPVKSFRTTYNDSVGTLPAGLAPAFIASGLSSTVGATQTISGTITTPGIYPVTVRVYENTNYGGDFAAQIFNICVLGFSPQPATTTTINSGQSATLTCTATGFPIATTLHNVTPTVSYQWYLGTSGTGSAISGASGFLNQASPTASYTTPSALSGTTYYWVKVTSVLSGNTVVANSTTAAVTVTSSPFETWASSSGLPVGQRGPTQTPQNDGVTNLEKFAFNLDPRIPDVRRLTAGANALSESAGLPVGSRVGGMLRIEFLRRKASGNPGVTYKPQFSTSLGTWADFTGTESAANAADPAWERVTVTDTVGGTARFGRVKVSQTP